MSSFKKMWQKPSENALELSIIIQSTLQKNLVNLDNASTLILNYSL